MPTDALRAATGARAEEEEVGEEDVKTVALAKGCVPDLARGLGGISLMRITRKATRAFLLCHQHQ